jgi:hypothetical protein
MRTLGDFLADPRQNFKGRPWGKQGGVGASPGVMIVSLRKRLGGKKTMKNMTVMLVVVGFTIFLTGGLAAADRFVPPMATASPPQWTAIPNVPGVEYAPNIGQDMFRYQGSFYNFQGGGWFRAPAINGPWVSMPQPPRVFHTIQAPYFKVPPGWEKGNKTGWHGGRMPPGQMKKGYR